MGKGSGRRGARDCALISSDTNRPRLQLPFHPPPPRSLFLRRYVLLFTHAVTFLLVVLPRRLSPREWIDTRRGGCNDGVRDSICRNKIISLLLSLSLFPDRDDPVR